MPEWTQGGLTERPNVTVLKTVVRKDRGFESLALRQRRGRVRDGRGPVVVGSLVPQERRAGVRGSSGAPLLGRPGDPTRTHGTLDPGNVEEGL